MADQNQELAETMQRVNHELEAYGHLTRDTADALNDARVGIKGFSAATRTTGSAIGKLGDAAAAGAEAMYKGEKGAAAFNNSIDSMSQSAELAAAALALIIPGGPIIKLLVAGIGTAVAAYAKYTKAANDMADGLYKGFTQLSKSGAAASDGLTGVYKDLTKLGMGMQDLDKYVEVINSNSKDLAMFGGSVFQGRKQFVEMGEAMQANRKSLMNLGLSQDEIAQGAAKYLSLQNRVGQAQGKTTAELAEGARKYLVEMDGLSKLTGQTRKEMEDQMEAARSEQRFRAKLDEMRANGQKAEADELEKANLLLSSRSKEAGQAFRDLSTGMVTTEAAQKGLLSSNGELMVQAQKITSGQATAAEGVGAASEAIGKFAKDNRTLALVGVYEDIGLSYKESSELANFAASDITKALQKIKEEQEKQGATGKEATDKLQAAQVNLRDEQIQATKSLQDFVFDGTIPATQKMIALAKATTAAGDKMNEIFGTPGYGGEGQYGKNGSGTMAGSLAATGAGALAGAAAGSLLGPVGTAVGGVVGGAAGFFGYDLFGGSGEKPAQQAGGGMAPKSAAPVSLSGGGGPPTGEMKPSDFIKFTNGTGDEEHFNRLHPQVREAFLNMAQQYNALNPGKKLQMNSGFRSPEEQASVNSGTNPKAAPGMSLHQQGRAIDINSSQVQELQQTGLLSRSGFRPLEGDPPHIFMRDGGIAEGPDSGYPATLHGTEAVIPLKDGAVPVKLDQQTLFNAFDEANKSNPILNQLLSRSLPGLDKMQTLAGASETLGSDQTLAGKVLDIATMLNPTVRVVALLADSFKAITDLPKADEAVAQKPATENSEVMMLGEEFKSAIKDLSNNNTTQADPQMMSLLEELVREQRTANDINTRILQVSAN